MIELYIYIYRNIKFVKTTLQNTIELYLNDVVLMSKLNLFLVHYSVSFCFQFIMSV